MPCDSIKLYDEVKYELYMMLCGLTHCPRNMTHLVSLLP